MKKRIFLVPSWKKKIVDYVTKVVYHEMKNNKYFLKIEKEKGGKEKSNQGDKRWKGNEMESMEDIRGI